MTKLYDGQLTDLLSGNGLSYNPDVIAFSYAVQQEKQRIMRLAQQTRTLAVIDELPEPVLDVLSVELRTPYYLESMSIEDKRNVIKNTLSWYKYAGTPYAVIELVETLFGTGTIVEWFNYEEGPYTPGTFDITTGAPMTEDILTSLTRIIQKVKNSRSHLRKITILRDVKAAEKAAAYVQSWPCVTISNVLTAKRNEKAVAYGGAATNTVSRVTIK